MSKIQADMDRVIQYAESLGITVKIKAYIPRSHTAAEVDLEGRRITLYPKPKESKRDQVCSLLHELCHFTNYLIDPNSYDVYEAWSGSFDPGSDTKDVRYGVYAIEKRDISGMLGLYELLGLSGISRNYVAMQREYDIWVYAFWYFRGRMPKRKEKKVKLLALEFKHGLKP